MSLSLLDAVCRYFSRLGLSLIALDALQIVVPGPYDGMLRGQNGLGATSATNANALRLKLKPRDFKIGAITLSTPPSRIDARLTVLHNINQLFVVHQALWTTYNLYIVDTGLSPRRSEDGGAKDDQKPDEARKAQGEESSRM